TSAHRAHTATYSAANATAPASPLVTPSNAATARPTSPTQKPGRRDRGRGGVMTCGRAAAWPGVPLDPFRDVALRRRRRAFPCPRGLTRARARDCPARRAVLRGVVVRRTRGGIVGRRAGEEGEIAGPHGPRQVHPHGAAPARLVDADPVGSGCAAAHAGDPRDPRPRAPRVVRRALEARSGEHVV